MYIIKDWYNNIMFNAMLFKSFEDAWCHIYENISDEDNAYDDFIVVVK